MTVYQIIAKLIGPIGPLGETNEDERRYKNLQHACEVTDALLVDIRDVAAHKISHQYSVRRAGECAASFLERNEIGE